MNGDRDARKSRKELQEAKTYVDAIQLPDIKDQRLFLEELVSAGQIDPEMMQALNLGPSAMEGISSDPRLKSYQMEALESLAGVAESGMTPEDQAAFELARKSVASENQAKQGQILQEMQARGQGGSGAELITRLKSNQSSADALQNAQLEEVKAKAAARREALAQVGNMSSNMRSQDFNEAAEIAKAKDLINQFNTQNQQTISNQNVQSRNDAQVGNLQNRQNLMNQNTGTRNTQQQYNKELMQRQFDNQMVKANARNGVSSNIANSYAQSAANKSAMEGQLMGAAISAGAAAATGGASEAGKVKK